ncbi:hypothetical protein D3C85_1436120 [compost metagenome]
MVPAVPHPRIARPGTGRLATGRLQARQALVSRHVEEHGHQHVTEQIQAAANADAQAARQWPAQPGPGQQDRAGHGGAEKQREEQAVEHHLVDRLHGRHRTLCRNALQGLHDEVGEGEEQPAHQPATQGGNKDQQQ